MVNLFRRFSNDEVARAVGPRLPPGAKVLTPPAGLCYTRLSRALCSERRRRESPPNTEKFAIA